jgi:predicted aldo/keto reductase-like oxidoreductase
MGRTGLDISILSIGAMRLPEDEGEAVALLRRAIDLGCNYIDTSRGYGDSEIKVGKALKDGYREKVVLSTKCSPWNFKRPGYTSSADDARRRIDESFERLDVDRLDFYQVWSINDREGYTKASEAGGIVDGVRKAMDDGLIDHVGATTHAPEDVLIEMIDSGIFESMTFSYHLMKRGCEKAIAHAHEKGVGVVVMNPMGGGTFGWESRVIRELLPESALSSKQLALKFVTDNPNVTCAISGFTRMSDVEENVAAAKLPPLSDAERRSLAERVSVLEGEGRKLCTQCGYCMPCEQGVNIPAIFTLVNRARLFGWKESARESYARMDPSARADRCTECGECEEKCTNDVAIREELEKAHELLTQR